MSNEKEINEVNQLSIEDLQNPKLSTIPVDSAELEAEEKIMEGVEEITEEDYNKKNYVKISPTFYVQALPVSDENKEGILFKVFNPEENTVEVRELTEIEQHDILVHELKQSRKKFNPIKHGVVKNVGTTTVVNSIGMERKVKEKTLVTNITTNQFGSDYKQKRKRRNKLAKASRKVNRRK